MQELPRVCVIGAGSSGIAVAKALWDKGIPFDCYEASDRVGGNWVFKNKNKMSSAYRSLHINTSRNRMQYADFPMPPNYPDFPHHSLIAEYFDAYVEHFGFRHKIEFEIGVEKVEKNADGLYRVSLRDGRVRHYDAVAVANGHHWDPRLPEPEFPGEFDGVTLHSHHYIDPGEPHDLVGKRVVVLGMGNSAMDIACELGRPGVAQRVFLAARRGAWVVPKYIFGRPLDKSVPLPEWFPRRLRGLLARSVYRIAVGSPENYGLPLPDHQLWQAHPTISSELFVRVGSGDVIPKPNLRRLAGGEVEFADGSRERVDAIVYCTGYKVTFPFFEESFVAADDNDLPLFRRVFRPGLPDLFFFGLLQPLGAIMPIAEAQAKWVGDYLLGRYALPSEAEMRRDIDQERSEMFTRYVKSKRHTMQVDYDVYMRNLARERALGRRRAERVGFRLPIAARARSSPLAEASPRSNSGVRLA